MAVIDYTYGGSPYGSAPYGGVVGVGTTPGGQYVRWYTVRADLQALVSPGVPDVLWVPVGPPVGPVRSVLTGVRMLSSWTTSPPTDDFVLRVTIPYNNSPKVPNGTENVGWDGNSSGGTFVALQTIAANATISNCVFRCDVVAGTNVTFNNCVFFGQVAVASRAGLVICNGSATFNRCTIYGEPGTVEYWRNGIRASTGTIRTTRCVIMRVIDPLRSSGARFISNGDILGPTAFFDNDGDHPNPPNAGWTHSDPLQSTNPPLAGPHEIIGSVVWGVADTTGVTWSGGSPGVGTASNGPTTIGMPATALNAGFVNAQGLCTRSNGISFTNAGPQQAIIEDCWIHGVDAPSGMVQFVTTSGGANTVTARRNRIYLDGKPTSSFFIFSYPAATIKTIGTGADANIYADDPINPAPLRGLPLTFTTSGAKYTV